jgi:para-nitrobenzyl esterase
MIGILFLIQIIYSQFVELNTPSARYRTLQFDQQPLTFLGIPFGTSKRWEYPIEIQQDSLIDATRKGPSCPQICRNVAAFCPETIDENCLNLNIWTPFTNISILPERSLPVLVYIHGGSFENGSGSIGVFNGTFLANSLNAIIVTFNYRLSIFGFPGDSLDSRLPINPGILDQRLALSWIHTHIQYFGGDISKMTLMGQSAGASSVLLHLAQEPTQAWFQRGIVFSVPAVPFQTSLQGKKKFRGFVDHMNCTRTPGFDSKSCLNRFSTRDIIDNYEEYQKSRQQGKMRFDNWLQPVVDGFEIGSYPLDALQKLSNKDIIIGTLSNETSRIVERVVPEMAPESATIILSNAIFGNQLRPKLEDIYQWRAKSTRNSMIHMLSDFLFVCPTHRSSKLASERNQVFEYFWELPWSGGSSDVLGKICGKEACHTTDTVYFFNQAADTTDEQIAASFRNRIRSFIENGSPNVPDQSQWTAMTKNNTDVYIVSKDSSVSNHPRTLFCDIWDSNGYVYEDNYEIPPSPTFDGIDSKWILSVLIVFLSINGFQILLLISSRFSRKVLFVNIKILQAQEKRSSEYLKMMGKLLDVTPIPVRLRVSQLDFYAKTKEDTPKHILQNISAAFEPYSMTAVMGPSGSGKTTLLSLVFLYLSRLHLKCKTS